MTDCNRTPIAFSSLAGKTVLADFAGGTITSDAGALLLRQVDRHLGLVDAFDRCIPDPRQPELITHDQRTLLAQRIFAIALGYEDLNDHQQIRHDPVLQLLSERRIDDTQPLASAPTLCRLENRIDRRTLFELSRALVEVFIRSQPTPPQELILDFDATDAPIHGQQIGRFFHGYYDHYCFLPLYVFCGDHLLCAYLRPANIDAAKHSRGILKLLVDRLRQAWPGVKIIFRADSGFCRWRLLRWCERHDVHYLVGLAKNKVLEKLGAQTIQQAQNLFEQTRQSQRCFAEFVYAAGSWDRPRRVILRHEHTDQGANPRFVVTNLQDEGQRLYEGVYCLRGECENRIKEQQLDLFADRTSCHQFLANQFRLLLSAAAYVLMDHLRRLGLKDTLLQDAQAGTIRLKLLKIGARVTHSVRRVVLHLASGYPLQEVFHAVARRLARLPAPA